MLPRYATARLPINQHWRVNGTRTAQIENESNPTSTTPLSMIAQSTALRPNKRSAINLAIGSPQFFAGKEIGPFSQAGQGLVGICNILLPASLRAELLLRELMPDKPKWPVTLVAALHWRQSLALTSRARGRSCRCTVKSIPAGKRRK